MSSNPVSFITDPISDVLGTSGGGGGILGAVEDVGKTVGGAVEDVVQGGSNLLAKADKAVGYKLPHIAAAFAVPYLAPYLSGQAAGAEAAALLDAAALAEGGTTAGMAAAANTGLPVGTATLAGLAEVSTALPYTEAFDAVNQATRLGLSEADIARNLTTTGMKDYLAQDMARLATQGLSPDQIVQTLSYSYSPTELAGTGIESKALGLPSKGITANQALMGARLASGLLGRAQPQPQLRQPQLQMPQIRPAGAVDYSGLLNLLSPRATTRNTNSLLG